MGKINFLPVVILVTAGTLIQGCNGSSSSGRSGKDSASVAGSGGPRLIKLWETDSSVRAPESALWDEDLGLFFVSDINGDGSAKDGNGFISQLGPDGKILKLHWLDGLDAPKGLALFDGTLYAADLDSLVIMDIASSRIRAKIFVPGSTFLNDAAADPKGNIYLSDTRQGKVFCYRNGRVSVLLQGPEVKGANGLLWWKDQLWILTSGGIYQYQPVTGKLTLFSSAVRDGDGLAAVNDSELIASRWAGEVYYIHGDGSAVKLLDTRGTHRNTADIGYLPGRSMLTVPTFTGNTVAAYKLLP